MPLRALGDFAITSLNRKKFAWQLAFKSGKISLVISMPE